MALNTETIKHINGDTQDIIDVVLECYLANRTQVEELAQSLRGATDAITANNVYEFVKNSIRYKEDPPGVQWVKTPNRLLADGVGDCKSFSILQMSLLYCLGVDAMFRFAAYHNNPNYTHVYPVAIVNGVQVPQDVTAFQLRKIQYGKECRYSKKIDYSMTGTKISVLAGVPDEPTTTNSFFTDGKKELNSYQFYLLSIIDLCESRLTIAKSDLEIQSLLNEMDCYYCMLRLLDVVGSDRQNMTIAGYVMAYYISEGRFESVYTSNEQRNAAVNQLSAEIINSYNQVINSPSSVVITPELEAVSEEFMSWWQTFIVDKNDEAQSIDIPGVGASTANVPECIKAFSPALLYTTEANKMGTARAARKQERENKLIDYIIATNSNLDRATVQNLIHSGVILNMGAEPYKVIQALKAGRNYAAIGATQEDLFYAEFGVDSYGNELLDTEMNQLLSQKSDSSALASLQTASSMASGGGNWIDIMTGVTQVLSSTAQIFNSITPSIVALTGNQEKATLSSYTGLQTIIPNTDDWTSNPLFVTAGVGLLGVGGYYLIKNKKKSKKRKK